MVQRALEDAGIRCIRIDGNFSASNRQRALDQLKNDDDTKAILITISCGGVGLDLTAASRASPGASMEPCLEDQALARVHRMGQVRRVTTIRYVMKESFEEDVIPVQDRKKLLADLLLSHDPSQQIQSLIG